MHPLVDVDRAPFRAFALAEEHPPFSSGTHAHQKHQLLYASRGIVLLVTPDEEWSLPPLRAAWLPAGIPHSVESRTGIALRTVYFDAQAFPRADGVRVFDVPLLAREMLLYAMRWGPQPSDDDDARDEFFRVLLRMTTEWFANAHPLVLPRARSKELQRVTEYVREHLEDVTAGSAAKAGHVSLRTLNRRFEIELRTTFRAYLQTARILRAMEYLSDSDASVSRVALDVGFQGLAAFTTAFRSRTGQTPSAYRASTMAR